MLPLERSRLWWHEHGKDCGSLAAQLSPGERRCCHPCSSKLSRPSPGHRLSAAQYQSSPGPEWSTHSQGPSWERAAQKKRKDTGPGQNPRTRSSTSWGQTRVRRDPAAWLPLLLVLSRSVVSDSLRAMDCSHQASLSRGFSGKNTGVGCCALTAAPSSTKNRRKPSLSTLYKSNPFPHTALLCFRFLNTFVIIKFSAFCISLFLSSLCRILTL